MILLIQFCNIVKKTYLGHLAILIVVKLANVQVVDIHVSGLLRVNLAVVGDGLNRYVYCVFIAILNQIVDLVKDSAEDFDVFVVGFVGCL